MDEDEADILRILAIIFRGQKIVKKAELERTLSFDMQWMNPNDASQVIDKLLTTSWLVEDDGGISPGADTTGITTPLGWFPRLDWLMSPSSNSNVVTPKKEVDKIEPIPIPEVKPRKEVSEGIDPRASFESRLTRFIANSSGVERTEVNRRAERKVLALGAMTKWMALSLVAKEQGLDMSEIVTQLSL